MHFYHFLQSHSSNTFSPQHPSCLKNWTENPSESSSPFTEPCRYGGMHVLQRLESAFCFPSLLHRHCRLWICIRRANFAILENCENYCNSVTYSSFSLKLGRRPIQSKQASLPVSHFFVFHFLPCFPSWRRETIHFFLFSVSEVLSRLHIGFYAHLLTLNHFQARCDDSCWFCRWEETVGIGFGVVVVEHDHSLMFDEIFIFVWSGLFRKMGWVNFR